MRYRVIETVQFSDLWQSAIDSGVIEPVEASRLQGLAEFLSLEPDRFPLFENTGEQIGLRWVHFVTGSRDRVEIWYTVVEDDLCVYLESVEVIPQQQPPLFNFDP